ncbi:hypothetical protein BHM03_00015406 [Ensete ventricosum]|nr:hypothetical protein BHM03_00015406 [Ensete ventricosum]
MAWWNKKVVFPVKRALVAVAARVKARKHGNLTPPPPHSARTPRRRPNMWIRRCAGDVGDAEEIGGASKAEEAAVLLAAVSLIAANDVL